MEIKLSPELERKINARVGDAYASPSHVVEEALKAFFGPEILNEADIEDLNRRIDLGLADARRDDCIDGDLAREMAIQRLKKPRRA
jgi:Arc/MetJ-type ribon-helix-helix transcriptional regulator